MLEVIPIIAPLFILLGVGMAAGFSQRFRSAQAGLNAFVFNFSLPAFLFTALAHAPISDGVPVAFVTISFGTTLGVAALVYALTALRRKVSPGGVAPGPLAIAASYGNVGYLGVPIVMSVVGPSAALGAALGQLLHNVLFMVGYPLFKSLRGPRSGGPGGGTGRGSARVGAVLWRVLKQSILFNPVVLSVIAGVIAGAAPESLPTVIDESITMLGQAAVPTAMFAVGLSIKPAFEGMRSGSVPVAAVLAASAVKLLVLPLATVLALLAFGGSLSHPWVASAVIMAAMPISSTASILVYEFGDDVRPVGAATLITSIAAVITIPLAIALIP